MDRFDIKQISDELSGIIKAHVKVSGRFSGQTSLFSDQDSIKNKIDLLERVLEITIMGDVHKIISYYQAVPLIGVK